VARPLLLWFEAASLEARNHGWQAGRWMDSVWKRYECRCALPGRSLSFMLRCCLSLRAMVVERRQSNAGGTARRWDGAWDMTSMGLEGRARARRRQHRQATPAAHWLAAVLLLLDWNPSCPFWPCLPFSVQPSKLFLTAINALSLEDRSIVWLRSTPTMVSTSGIALEL
jgi:hypothetical protein